MNIRSRVIRELEMNRGSDLSGQDLALRLGVSRNSIWKIIKSLKAEGYAISSVTNRGYRLDRNNNDISPEGIKHYMNQNYNEIPIYYYDSVDSTNEEAKRLVVDRDEPIMLVIANGQTSGKGRRGRSFYSPSDTGIYMSLVYRLNANLDIAMGATSMAAVAVVEAIRELTQVQPMIKWVNDIYVCDKKVCGILTEAVSNIETREVTNIIIGIGINISTQDFPREIEDTAMSLCSILSPHDNIDEDPIYNKTMSVCEESDRIIIRNELMGRVISKLLDMLANISDRSYINLYRQYSCVIGREIFYIVGDTKTMAKAIDIDDEGGLVVEYNDGRRETLRSGEVSVRLSPSHT